MEAITDNLRFTGTEINYYFLCKKKLWYFSHYIQMEQESDAVHIGKLIHESSYEREKKERIAEEMQFERHHSDDGSYVTETPKIGRNEPCPCGSEKI